MANESLIGGGPAAAPVADVTTANFMAEVVDASFDQPIIVDFWAPWCGPCKQLGPILEKIVRAANGAVRMVKASGAEDREGARADAAAVESYQQFIRAARWGAVAGHAARV